MLVPSFLLFLFLKNVFEKVEDAQKLGVKIFKENISISSAECFFNFPKKSLHTFLLLLLAGGEPWACCLPGLPWGLDVDGIAEAAPPEAAAAAPLALWDSWARFSSACNCLASSSLKFQK